MAASDFLLIEFGSHNQESKSVTETSKLRLNETNDSTANYRRPFRRLILETLRLKTSQAISMANPQQSWGTSRSLIKRVQNNDQESWNSLCDIYVPLVYGWARKSQLQESDSQDIVQDVFRNVATGLKNFQYDGGKGTFRGWLWTITRNAIRKHFNHLSDQVANAEGGTRAMQKIGDVPDWIDSDSDEPKIDEREETALLKRALKMVENDFAPHIWQAFWRFTIEGETAKDVAEDLGMSTCGVRQAKFRVLARLREVLG